MKARFAFLLVLVLSLPAAAQLTKLKDWDRSPEYVYLATDAEKKEWKDVKTDEQAARFLALFWARRNPDLKNPANEFKQAFDTRVANADKLFALGTKRGAFTERGKLLILLGPPKSMERRTGVGNRGNFRAGESQGANDATGYGSGLEPFAVLFLYDKAQLPGWADVKTLETMFNVDPGAASEQMTNSETIKKLEALAVQKAVVHPELKEPPVYKSRQEAEAEMKAAAEAAKGPALSPGAKEALEATLAKAPAGPLSTQVLAYKDGSLLLQVQLFAQASSVPAPDAAKLALVVRDKQGAEVLRREGAAALKKSKGDFFADRSLPITEGEFDVAAALLDAEGKVLASGHRGVVAKVPVKGTLAASELILAYNDMPAEAGARADDPFTFSGRKFVSRGEARFDKTDGFSYAMRVYDPAVDPATHKMLLKRVVKIKPKSGGSSMEVPQPPEEPTDAPNVADGMIVVDLAANVVDTNMGEYFKPGATYVLSVTIDDGKSKVTSSAEFSVK